MSKQGWIKLHRKLLDWEWYGDIKVSRLFIHCLLKANHQPAKWQGIDIKRGEFITSISTLELETCLSKQSIRSAIKKLEKTKNLTHKTTNKYTLISITCYEDYQDEQQTNNKQITNKQQTNNKQITTNKNKKNERKKEVVENSLLLLLQESFIAETNNAIENFSLQYIPKLFKDEYFKRTGRNDRINFYWEEFTEFWLSEEARKYKKGVKANWKATWGKHIERILPNLVKIPKTDNTQIKDISTLN
jgi:uncharacterized membrane protein YfhO